MKLSGLFSSLFAIRFSLIFGKKIGGGGKTEKSREKRSNDFESQLIDMAANIKSKAIPVKSSIKDLRKTFEIKDHSRTFGRSSISKTIQVPAKDLRNQISFKDDRKI